MVFFVYELPSLDTNDRWHGIDSECLELKLKNNVF
jgi:hypothetical protein